MASANIWKTFEGLLPKQARFIATVRGIQGTRSEVELRSGVRMWVNGATVPVGSKAQVVNGVIQSEAKDLPVSEVEI